MKNRRIIFLAACMCSVVFLSGCSPNSLMDKMMELRPDSFVFSQCRYFKETAMLFM